jgi:DNA-binding response OmpR family regulator
MDRVRMTALVVDDDVCVRAILVELLIEVGFEVSQASNGFSGLLRAAEMRPQLILLDLTLPEVSGLEVLRELREKQGMRETAIVIVTANPDQLSEAQMAEIDAVVRKPFDVVELLATLNQAVVRAAHRAAEFQRVLAAAPAQAIHERRAARLVGGKRPTRGRRL